MNKQLAKMLSEVMNDAEEESSRPKVSVQRMYQLYTTPQEPFEVGDVIELKEGMEYASNPKYGHECVVMDVLPEPIHSQMPDSPTEVPYFMPVDMVIGVSARGDFAQIYADSRRFRLKKRPLKA